MKPGVPMDLVTCVLQPSPAHDIPVLVLPHHPGQGMECVVWSFWVLLLLLPGKLLSFRCPSFIWKLIWDLCPSIRFVHDWTVGPKVVRSASHKGGIFRGSLVCIGSHFPPGNLGIKIARYWGMLCLLWVNEIMKLMKEGNRLFCTLVGHGASWVLQTEKGAGEKCINFFF